MRACALCRRYGSVSCRNPRNRSRARRVVFGKRYRSSEKTFRGRLPGVLELMLLVMPDRKTPRGAGGATVEEFQGYWRWGLDVPVEADGWDCEAWELMEEGSTSRA